MIKQIKEQSGKILSAKQVPGGIAVNLILPSEYEEFTICAAVYNNAPGTLSAVTFSDITEHNSDCGTFMIPINTNGEKAKIVILKDADSMQPLSKGFVIKLNKEAANQ